MSDICGNGRQRGLLCKRNRAIKLQHPRLYLIPVSIYKFYKLKLIDEAFSSVLCFCQIV